MKKLLALLLFAAALPAYAEPINCNVAVIDMFRVSEGFERYLASRNVLEARKAELQQIVDEQEREVLTLIEELEAIRATASQEELSRRRTEIERRDRELRDFVGSSNAKFRDDLDTLQFRTRFEIETVVQMVARRKNVALVLEKNMTLFAADALDVTPEIIAELNARFKPLAADLSAGGMRRPAVTPPTAFPAPEGPRRGWPFRDER